MATDNVPPPLDPDRLFAVPIIQRGLFYGLFQGTRDDLHALSDEELATRIANAPSEAEDAAARRVLLGAFSELLAWRVVERFRQHSHEHVSERASPRPRAACTVQPAPPLPDVKQRLAKRRLPVEQRKREAEDEAQRLLCELIPLRRCREYCADEIARCGGVAAFEAWFSDPQWLASQVAPPTVIQQTLDALKAFRLADAERALAYSRMREARRVIAGLQGPAS